jgi:hypothetical protein
MDLTDVKWRKSSWSGGNGGNCVEIAAVPGWRKSSWSGGNGGNCVEVAAANPAGKPHRVVAVRDSKDPDGPKLIFTATAWRMFTAAAKHGTFDLA